MSPTLAELLLDTFDAKVLEGALGDAEASESSIVRDAVLDLAPQLLDIEVPDVLARALADVAALHEYADPTRHPPDELDVVSLGDYTIQTEHHPAIEVRRGDAVVRKIVFDVVAELVVSGSQVTVQGGRIRAVQVGKLLVRGHLGLGGVVLAECESKAVELPGRIELEEGIEIG